MPINAHPEFFEVQTEVAQAKNKEEKLFLLEKLLSVAPSHKGAEKLRGDIRLKIAKLKKELEKEKTQKKGGKSKFSVKKTGDAQVVLLGFTNSGKSSLLSILTNARPKISEWPFTTAIPEIGTMDVEGAKIQIVELPSLKDNLDEDTEILSIARTSDLIICVVTTNEEVDRLLKILEIKRITSPKIILGNKEDYLFLNKAEFMVSTLTKKNIERLKDEIIKKLNLIKVRTKEPGKPPENKPVVLKKGATIKKLAEAIHKDFVKKFSHALIWGKSAKFPGQRTGAEHTLEEGDIVEIYLKK